MQHADRIVNKHSRNLQNLSIQWNLEFHRNSSTFKCPNLDSVGQIIYIFFPIYSIFSYSSLFSSLLHAFIITHLLWPLGNHNILASNLPLPVHSKHCGQGYLSGSPFWLCHLMSQSLRWFSVSLHYKVKFLLCNFKVLQESALAYKWISCSFLLSPAYCVHP